MMERLAGLADRRARRVLISAAIVLVVAGALGAGVAERLDPFGADDPDTESVIAEQRLEGAGFRATGVVVLVEGIDPESTDGRERIETITRVLEADPDVASVSSFLSSGSHDFVSRDGDSTYLAAPSHQPTTTGATTPQSG
jgi:putative drug exporter of the RND superfamily